MQEKYDEFLETIDSPNTRKTFKSLRSLGDYDYSNCTPEQLEQIILEMKPNTHKAIITICYSLGVYAKYLGDDHLYQMVQGLDRKAIWEKAKPNATQRFISHSNFEKVYHDIGVYEELNSLYFQTLFRCVYEGIYNDDMSALKNLRASDIRGNVVTLREDNGHEYHLEISSKLAADLKELGDLHTWERKNRYGVFEMPIDGLHHDSCFKVEKRKEGSEYSYRYSYYRLLRKIAKEYLEYSLLPLQLYVSGIMYRIQRKLNQSGLWIDYAFAEQNRSRLVGEIIADELARCNYNIEVKAFRQLVKGHLEVFRESDTDYFEIRRKYYGNHKT